jgi:hypothetical protein
MTITTKILLIIIAILTVSGVGFIIYQQHMFNVQTVEMQKSLIEQKQLLDNSIRSQSQYVNEKGFQDFVKQNQVSLDAIKKDISSIGGQLSAVNVVVANSQGQKGAGVPSTTTTTGPTITDPVVKVNCLDPTSNCISDKYNYFRTTQLLKLQENFGEKGDVLVPIGNVEFFAGTPDNKPWSYTILPRQYKVDNTIAHTANGQTVVYNTLAIKAEGKEYTIPITSSNTVERYPESSYSWWNARLSLGLTGSASIANSMVKAEATPSISVSIMSYGRTKTNPDIRVLSLGVGYNMVDRKPAFELSPIQLNVAKSISGTFINNLWVGPVIGTNTAGAIQLGFGIQVGL